MSYTVRQPADTAASASISTPVRSTVRTVATISTPPGCGVASTSTPESAMGWQSGTRSGVFFAARMPASRAAASDGDLEAAEEEPVARRAGGDALAAVLALGGEAEPLRGRARRDDDRVG